MEELAARCAGVSLHLQNLDTAALGLVLLKGLWPPISDIPLTDRYLRWTFRGLGKV